MITSKARYAVLELMALRSNPLHLRAIAEATDLSPRGAAITCAFFVKAKVFKVTRDGNRKYFVLNSRCALAEIIKSHFELERQRELAQRATGYQGGADTLDFIDQVASVTSTADL